MLRDAYGRDQHRRRRRVARRRDGGREWERRLRIPRMSTYVPFADMTPLPVSHVPFFEEEMIP